MSVKTDGTLAATMVREGNWLFRWRSYLPVAVLVPVVIVAVGERSSGGPTPAVVASLVVAAVLVVAGLAVRAVVAGHAPRGASGRTTRVGPKATRLSTTGPYAVVRHPLYVGNFLIWIGLVGALAPGWPCAAAGLAFWLYYERIAMAEEACLAAAHGEAFASWAARTGAFIPNGHVWTAPELEFCWRTCLRREYTTVALAGLAAVAVAWLRLGTSVPAAALVVGGVVVAGGYLTVMAVKLRTSWLHAAGR
jgi:protein-S-isoprenylcysteine O-methyltransferase Ste14